MTKLKLAVVVTHPIQHFAPIYQRLAQNGRIDVFVIFLTDTGAREYFDPAFGRKLTWDVDLIGGYRYKVLRPGLARVPKGFLKTYAPEVARLLDQEQPHAVLVYGYTRGFNWVARRWVRRNHRRLLYCSDSALIDEPRGWRSVLKRAFLKQFFKGVNVFLTAGDQNERFLKYYGVEASRMIRCPLPVDLERLTSGFLNAPRQKRDECRKALGILGNEFVATHCGKLSEIKRPLDLARAVLTLREEGVPAVGLFIGTGVYTDKLNQLAKTAPAGSLRVEGFVNQSALSKYYAASDALVVCSEHDPHPLVATEAAAFGLPLIMSDRAGCVGPTDVARPAENALAFPCGNVHALAECIHHLIKNPAKHEAMSTASRRIAETQDVSVAAREIEKAVFGDFRKC